MIDPAASFVEAARYLPALLFGLKGDLAGGLALNILLALLALPASLLLGVILGCFRVFSLRFLAPFAIAYTELVKSVPLVLMLFWMHYALPLFLGVRSLPPGLTAVAALTVYDMTKALSHDIQIQDIRLTHKSGGKHEFNR